MRPEQRVDERRFARIEFADHDEQEQLVKVEFSLAQLAHIVSGRRLAGQKLTQATQHRPFPGQQVARHLRQDPGVRR